MFQKEDCFRLGIISRLHSFKGEVSISLDVDDPQEYKELESVFVEIDGKLIPFFLESIRIDKKGYAIVKFENVDSEEKAKSLLKCGIYLPLDVLPELDEDEFYFFEIEGFTVIDENHGEIGVVKKVIDLSGNPLIEIDYKGSEILIPNQDEFVQKVDKVNQTLYVKTPEGLIDMYLE